MYVAFIDKTAKTLLLGDDPQEQKKRIHLITMHRYYFMNHRTSKSTTIHLEQRFIQTFKPCVPVECLENHLFSNM